MLGHAVAGHLCWAAAFTQPLGVRSSFFLSFFQPPAYRSRVPVKGRSLSIPAVDVYCSRPVDMMDLTLYEYFTQYNVSKVGQPCTVGIACSHEFSQHREPPYPLAL